MSERRFCKCHETRVEHIDYALDSLWCAGWRRQPGLRRLMDLGLDKRLEAAAEAARLEPTP